MEGHGTVPLFTYSEKDVREGLVRTRDKATVPCSKLDTLIRERWDSAMSEGIFRYDLQGVVTRTVPGGFGFIVQQNPKRRTHRRAPGHMTALRQDFDPSLFNFSKIKSEEMLFEICRVSDTGTELGQRHLMVVNVSPITHNHSLLIPEPKSCLPQVLTEDTIGLCLEMLALSNSSEFCIVANSLLAYASVNHLHYHILQVSLPVLASRVKGEHIGGSVYQLSDHPSPGFGFQLTSIQSCARDIHKVVEVFFQLDVPHNLLILRGDDFNGGRDPHQEEIRAILIPRKPFYGQKILSEFSPAACELAQGFIPIYDEHRYHTLTEDEILQVLKEQMMTPGEFQILRDKVASLFN